MNKIKELAQWALIIALLIAITFVSWQVWGMFIRYHAGC